MAKRKPTRLKERVFLLVLALLFIPSLVLAGGAVQTFPSLEETAKQAAANAPALDLSAEEAGFRARDLYQQIQFKSDQLAIAEEVKGHFSKAAGKAEEKFDQGDEDISQSNITKLKLGLSGAVNDVLVLKKEIHFAKLSLGHLLGWQVNEDTPLSEPGIEARDFPFSSLEDYLAGLNSPGQPADRRACSGALAAGKRLLLMEAYLDVDEARQQMELAKKSRKITRTLLVTEVANYDFGIGKSEDLFEALIIYTRVLRGYYETAYNLNRAILELDRRAHCPG